MILLFKLIIITVIIVMGLKIVMSEGMLLEKLGNYFEKKVDEGHKVYMMFFCPFCMATLFSIVAYFFAFGLEILPFEFNLKLLIRWPLIICGSSFISGNLWNLYETVNRIKEKNEDETDYYRNINETDFVGINKTKE